MMAFRIRGFFILATVVAISGSDLRAQNPLAGVQTPPTTFMAEALECSKPFLSASKGLLGCKVDLVDGMICIDGKGSTGTLHFDFSPTFAAITGLDLGGTQSH